MGAFVILALYFMRSLGTDIRREQTEWKKEASAAKEKDWTHKISIGAMPKQDRPDDDTWDQCPTPIGNWAHTCHSEIVIQGPCNGKCLLVAKCQDLDKKEQATTFEYNEGVTVEIKNVNGLLCRTEGVSCGVNFHGNLMMKNCKDGHTPQRHENRPDGIYIKSKDEDADPDRNWDNIRDKSVDASSSAVRNDPPSSQYQPNNYHNRDTGKWKDDAPAAAPSSVDWTHKLSLDPITSDQTRNARNHGSCPTPTGNWIHTCFSDLVIEGPCKGKCLLKAKCKNLDKKPQETSFEYNEGQSVDIKNVNGLLCKVEDGSPLCGVNFHGNLALKNCADGTIPRRQERHEDGLHEDTERAGRGDYEDPPAPRSRYDDDNGSWREPRRSRRYVDDDDDDDDDWSTRRRDRGPTREQERRWDAANEEDFSRRYGSREAQERRSWDSRPRSRGRDRYW